MKKSILILILTFSTSMHAINISVVNQTNASYGWKTKIEANSKFITKYKYLIRKNKNAFFSNIPNKCVIQVISNRPINRGTAISNSYITLREDINSDENIIIYIKECDANNTSCKKEVKKLEKSQKEEGQESKYYYLIKEKYK